MKDHIICVGILAVLLVSSMPLFMNAAEGDHDWTIETLDESPEGFTNYGTSIVVDASGVPHVAYVLRGPYALKYGVRESSGWKIEVVDPAGTNAWVSLKLDSQGRPHIAHSKGYSGLRYASKLGVNWEFEMVDTGPRCGVYASMDVDSQDRPHIAYWCLENYTLKYASWDGGKWLIRPIDVGTHDVSLALDSLDRPHISYFDVDNLQLKYAYYDGFSWNYEIVDVGVNISNSGTSIGVDSLGRAHISYVDYEAGVVKYAVRGLFSWMVEVVDNPYYGSSQGGIYCTSLALDSLDNPRIAYFHHTAGTALGYAWRDGTWSKEIVEQAYGTGSAPSLAIDRFDNPHITYLYHHKGFVKYAGIPTMLPDLSVTPSDIILDPSYPVSNGSAVSVTAVIQNTGNENASDIPVVSFDGDPANPIDERTIPLLAFGSSIPIEFQWVPNSTGIHDVCTHVDPEDEILEYNEDNNLACVQVHVYSTAAPGPPQIVNATLKGESHQDVGIAWLLSEDDGSGLQNVMGYEILTGQSYDETGSSYSAVGWRSAGNDSFQDSGAGEGDPADHFYVVCAINHFGNRTCSANQASKFTRPVSPGPNLVSVPLVQSAENIETVLQTVQYDKAWYYDSSLQQWNWHMTFKQYRRGLWNVSHSMGLWVNVTRNSNLTVAGVVPTQTTVHLYEGWNLVSFPSFNTTFSVSDLKVEIGATKVEGHILLPSYFLRVLGDEEMLQTGHGYWVKLEVDTDWTVEAS